MSRPRRRLDQALRCLWYVVLLFLYAPLLVVAIYSFNSINSPAVFAQPSLRWYRALWDNTAIWDAFYHSLLLALISSSLATVIGTLLGYGMYTHRHRRLGWLIWLIYLPILMPDIIYGISQMSFFSWLSRLRLFFDMGLTTMIIAHVSFQIPFVALLVYSRLFGLEDQLFEACRDLYANAWQRARYFLLPLLRPAILSGFFLAFTLSVDDFVISFFTAGPESTTLPIFIWSSIRRGITPEINAIASLMLLAIFTLAVGGLFGQWWRDQRRQR